jgi:hypothetical protein
VFVEEVSKAGDSWAIYPLVDGLGSSMPSKLDLVSVEKGSRVKFFKFRTIKVLATAKPKPSFSRGSTVLSQVHWQRETSFQNNYFLIY